METITMNYNELYGSEMAEAIQKEEPGITVLYLNPMTRGEYEKNSYIDGMRENIRLLKEIGEQT